MQCGTPAPEGFDGDQMIEVPVNSVVSLSTTQLPQLQALGHLDSLVAMDSYSFLYTNTPEVQAMIDAGALTDVNSDNNINVELLLDMEPDLVMANGYNPETDAYPLLMNAGIFTAVNSDWLEPTLLGRAEWLKFIALFYNEEAQAETLYDAIVSEYESVADLTAAIPADQRVTVLWNSYASFTDSWTVPGAGSWVGELLTDAGVNWILEDQVEGVQQDFAFESVFDAGSDAPIWVVNAYGVYSKDDLLALDERNGEFAAFQTGSVYNNTARVNANGGNDYWERGVSNPQLLLKDLVKLFYPDLLPDYAPQFYAKLG